VKAQILTPNTGNLTLAADAIRRGEVVGMPTETVYGLAGDALNPQALTRIFAVKERPTFDPLIVHVGVGVKRVEDLAQMRLVDSSRLTVAARTAVDQLISHFWPGPLTLVLPKTSQVPDLATSGLDTVAVRMPSHPIAQALIASAGTPLAAPSANRFGRISPTSASDVFEELGDRIEIILDGGKCTVGIESTILAIDAQGRGTLLRPGGLAREKIESVLGSSLLLGTDPGSKVLAPGMLLSHYSPRKKLYLLPEKFPLGKVALLVVTGQAAEAAEKFKTSTGVNAKVYSLSPSSDLEEAAQNLFSTLRAMDDSDCDVLVAESCSVNEGLGFAIADRLKRASAKS
jgi:L-threonylcarbamoyladenylate synthase